MCSIGNSCSSEIRYKGKLNFYSNSFLIRLVGSLDGPHWGKCGESNQIINKSGTRLATNLSKTKLDYIVVNFSSMPNEAYFLGTFLKEISI